MIRKVMFCALLFCGIACGVQAQAYWQQKVKYQMNIDMDVATNRLTGKQKLTYWNNSPDMLKKVFYHLYWNAFQPGSMMDERSRRQGAIMIGSKQDWDPRVKDRIQNLKPDEIGYQKVKSLSMNGVPQKFEALETILMVQLSKPILPGQKVEFDMDFEAQVPLQIRRSGRDNPDTKVRYSMSQWYPKLCEYDAEGWHPNPYVGREFYGVYGDFDVNITIDKSYILGGTGYLQNAAQVGYGYEPEGTKVIQPAGRKLTWKFSAPNVHDFMWAADPGFVHKTKKIRSDLTLHLLYKSTPDTAAKWEKILDDAARALPFIESHFGKYAYKQFSFITGGDGGMEYPMATLLAAANAWLHEWLHNWYYGMLGTNETQYPWMDEGFTTYAEEHTKAFLNDDTGFALAHDYKSYFKLVNSDRQEPMSTPGDHFNTNFAYGITSYSKGAMFLEQLGYIVGDATLHNILLQYYNHWRFKHPNANDFVRVAEQVSDAKLDWYKQYWVYSTKTIDYAIDSLWEEGGKTKIRLRNDGLMPMPVDFLITAKDGSKEMHYIPLDLMYHVKPNEDPSIARKVYPAWHWTSRTYTIESDKKIMDIATGEIDPSQRMADVERKNNRIVLSR